MIEGKTPREQEILRLTEAIRHVCTTTTKDIVAVVIALEIAARTAKQAAVETQGAEELEAIQAAANGVTQAIDMRKAANAAKEANGDITSVLRAIAQAVETDEEEEPTEEENRAAAKEEYDEIMQDKPAALFQAGLIVRNFLQYDLEEGNGSIGTHILAGMIHMRITAEGAIDCGWTREQVDALTDLVASVEVRTLMKAGASA